MGIRVAVCLDDEGGMMIFGRRQSRDRVLIDELCQSTEGKVYINGFSAGLFAAHTEQAAVVENPLAECPDGGTCFIENMAIIPYAERIERLIVYKWNRLYPSDVKIDVDLSGYGVIAREDFVGSSHDKITKLTLVRKRK